MQALSRPITVHWPGVECPPGNPQLDGDSSANLFDERYPVCRSNGGHTVVADREAHDKRLTDLGRRQAEQPTFRGIVPQFVVLDVVGISSGCHAVQVEPVARAGGGGDEEHP